MKPGSGDHSAKADATRERLLEAGRKILEEGSSRKVVDDIRSVDVTRRAEMSPGSLYYHWDNQKEYVNALVDYVIDDIETTGSEWFGVHLARFLEGLSDGVSFDHAVRSTCDPLFSTLAETPPFATRIGLWVSRGDDPPTAHRLARSYERIEDLWLTGISEALERQHRVMKNSFNARQLAKALIALTEGMLLREKVDRRARGGEQAAPSERASFSTLVVALYYAMTTPADDVRGPSQAAEGA